MEDIRAIQGKISTPEFSGLFYESDYIARNGKKNPMYLMNRDGFTLLVMGYTGEKAMNFKLTYINQFNAMEELLKGKLIEREKGIVVRQAFTRALKESGEDDRMHNHGYSTYTNVIYKCVFGKNAKQLREDFGISKDENLRDSFTSEQLAMVKNLEMIASGLMGNGWGYEEIKGLIMNYPPKGIESK